MDSKSGEKFYYRYIDESDVEPEKVKFAKLLLDHCRKVLNLPAEIEVQWIRKAEEIDYKIDQSYVKTLKILNKLSNNRSSKVVKFIDVDNSSFLGQSYGLSINKENMFLLRADIPLKQIGLTVAHECHHISNLRYYRPPLTREEMKAWDRAAEDFAHKIMKEVLRRKA